MLLLRNPIQRYAWGRTDGIARAVGTPATGQVEAELWVGTHPRGCSIVVDGPHHGRPLRDVVAEDPGRWLGPELAAQGLVELPFLLKVLAIGEPLSLQAHPSAAQAEAGFRREDDAGIALDAPHRTYRDPSAKPEALVAVERTLALCGFRPPDEAAALVAQVPGPALEPLAHALGGADEAGARLRAAMAWLLHLGPGEAAEVAAGAAQAAAARSGDDPSSPWPWVAELARLHPGDAGCLAPLLLDLVVLEPGDAVHLPAGNLHAYLQGVGVEIMASSDNVLRGGLTPKHVDVEELLAILRFAPGVPEPPARRLHGAVTAYDAGEAAFALARVDLGPGSATIVPTRPSLVLAVGSPLLAESAEGDVSVGAGEALFVPPGIGPVQLHHGQVAWWATTGDGLAELGGP
jgi:mannose-6-phosphate isomerase